LGEISGEETLVERSEIRTVRRGKDELVTFVCEARDRTSSGIDTRSRTSSHAHPTVTNTTAVTATATTTAACTTTTTSTASIVPLSALATDDGGYKVLAFRLRMLLLWKHDAGNRRGV
jgi:hypothetical protein